MKLTPRGHVVALAALYSTAILIGAFADDLGLIGWWL